jgi:ABC-type uncharacterized transport system ATPase subunit
MEGITKRFGAVLANDNLNLTVRAGTVHALLGENGAGKTTLMNILYGVHQPDSGHIVLRGQRVRLKSPRAAIRHGIGMIHQQFMLIPPFTVAENITLGLPPERGIFVDVRGVEQRVAQLSKMYGLDVDPQARVWQLPVGVQQRVEILKALYRRADLLILDEPTSVLTPAETEALFGVIRRLVADGHSVIFISHKLEEVMRISDEVTVLRLGRVVATERTAATSPEALARLMVGRDVILRLEKTPAQPDGIRLDIRNLQALNDRGLPALRGISLTIARGEILGIVGVDGNGQSELAEVITGLRPATKGQILLSGKDITTIDPRDRITRGVAYIPADRHRFGVVVDFSMASNLVIKTFARPPFTRGIILDQGAIGAHARAVAAQFDIRLASVHQRLRYLSGGNQQKVVLAREVSSRPEVLVAMQPTRGLDVGASEYVLRTILMQRDRGSAVLYISTELDEVLAISDRIAVLFDGQIMGLARTSDFSLDEVGLMMAGALRK